MKGKTILLYLGIPLLFSLCVWACEVTIRGVTTDSVVEWIYGFLLYAAPFLLWSIVVLFGQTPNNVSHAGFGASVVSLVLVASFWLYPGDPPDLPIQWLLYWPLTAMLAILSFLGIGLYNRVK